MPDHLKTTLEEFVNDLKVAGTTVTRNTIGNALQHNGLKSCRNRKVSSEQLSDLDKAWEKVLWSDETKIDLLGIKWACCVWDFGAIFSVKGTSPQHTGWGHVP